MSTYTYSSRKGPVSLMEAGPVVEIHASLQANQQLPHKESNYGRDGFGPTLLPRQAMYTPPEFQFVLQDHNYWAPYPSTPPPRSPKRHYNDHSYEEDWTKALLNSNALPPSRKPNPVPPPRESSRGRGSSRGSSRGKRGGASSEGRKLPPLPNMKNSGTTKLVPAAKHSYTRPPPPPKMDLPSPRLPSPDILSQNEIFARYKTPTPEPPLQNGAFKDIQRLWERKSTVTQPMLPDPSPAMSNDNDDDNSSRTSSAPERDGDDTETAPEAENYSDAVTRCVCNFDHDDGYMICCDRCSVWQHVDCMGIGRGSIPEEYLCELCAPRRIDRARARALQQRKRIEFRLNSSATSSSDTGDESDDEVRKRKRSASKSVKGLTLARPNSKQVSRMKRPVMKKQSKKKPQETKRATLDVGRITNMRQRRKSQPSKAPEEFPHNEPPASDSEKEKEAGEVASSFSDEGVSSPRDETSKLPMASWVERYEEAVTNHYSPELRARVATMRNTGQQQDFKGLPPTIAQKCRVVLMTFNKKGLVCNVPVSANQALMEFRGKMMLSTQFQLKPLPRLGRAAGSSFMPYVRFYPVARDLEICIDSRTYGNDARYVQQSCSPNSEIRHVIEKGLLHLYVVTLRSLDKNEEVTITHDPKNPLACSDHRCRYHTAKETVVNNNTEMAVERAERARRRHRQPATSEEEGEPSSPPVPPSRQRKESEARQRREAEEARIRKDLEIRSRKNSEVRPEIRSRRDSEGRQRKDSEKELQQKPSPPAVSAPAGVVPKRRRKNTEYESGDESEPERRKRRDTGDSDTHDGRRRTKSEAENASGSDKKLSREDRKMEAIMKAFERMEKLQSRSSHKPPSVQSIRTPRTEPSPREVDSSASSGAKTRRGGRRGGRQRRPSGKKRFVSGSDFTSQEENDDEEELKSPKEKEEFKFPSSRKSELDAGSHETQSGSSTPSVPSQYMRAIKSPSCAGGQAKRPSFSSILSIATAAEGGSAKKRWLRQAISEETDESATTPMTPGGSGGNTPQIETPGAEPFDYLTPLKKRRFARSSVTDTPTPSSPMSPEPSSLLQVPLPNGKELSPASKALAFLDVIEGVDLKQVQNVKKEIRFDIEEPKDQMPETFLEKSDSGDGNPEKPEEAEEIEEKEVKMESQSVLTESSEKVKGESKGVDYDKTEDVDIEGVEPSELEKEEVDIEGECEGDVLSRVRLEKAITDENVDVENDLEETDGRGHQNTSSDALQSKPTANTDGLKEPTSDVSVRDELAEAPAQKHRLEQYVESVSVPISGDKVDSTLGSSEPEVGQAVVEEVEAESVNSKDVDQVIMADVSADIMQSLQEPSVGLEPLSPVVESVHEPGPSSEDGAVEVASAQESVNSAKDVPDSGTEPPVLEREMSLSPISDDGQASSPLPLSEPRTPLQDEVDDPLSPRRQMGVTRLPVMDFTLPPSPPPPDFSFMRNVQEWEDAFSKKEEFGTTPEPPTLESLAIEELKPKKKLSISEYRRRKCTSTSEDRVTPTPEEPPPTSTLPTPPGESPLEDLRPITPVAIAEAANMFSQEDSSPPDEPPAETSPRGTKKDTCNERTRRGFFLRLRDSGQQASSSKSPKGPAPQPLPRGKWFTSTPRTPIVAPPPKAPVISVPPGAKINFPFPVRFNSSASAGEGVNGGPRAFHSPVTPMKLLKFPSLRPQNGVDSKSGQKDKGAKSGKS